MRKLMRSMARANMKAAGLGNFNRKHVVTTDNGKTRKVSYFGLYWRDWVNGNPHEKKKRGKKAKKKV